MDKERRREIRKKSYEKHKEQRLQYAKEYKAKNKESVRAYNEANKEKRRESMKEWYKQNKAANDAYVRAWREKNKERVLEYGRKHEEKRGVDPVLIEKRREKNRRYRASHLDFCRKLRQEYYKENCVELKKYAHNWRSHITKMVKEWLGGRCACCGETRPDMLTLDHIIAVGGKDRKSYHHDCFEVWTAYRECDGKKIGEMREKYQLLCWNCNFTKGIGAECRHKRGPLSEEGFSKHTLYMRNIGRRARQLLGGKCACCGELEPEFLAVDHVNNDGYKEKKYPHGYYYKIIKAFESGDEGAIAGVRERYQVLCHNCNGSKKVNGGICSHQQEKISAVAS